MTTNRIAPMIATMSSPTSPWWVAWKLPLHPTVARQPWTPRVLAGRGAASSDAFVRVVVLRSVNNEMVRARDNKHSSMPGHR